MKKYYLIPYEDVLNPSQYEAVMFEKGPALVIAGAGSGKTRTLTYRVARLVEDQVSPKSILLLTFTRKASKEMLDRASSLLDNRCSKVSGGTFHSFASYILRRYSSRIGFTPGFAILDRSDAEAIIEIIRREKKLNTKQRNFPRKGTIMSIISKAVNKSKSLSEIVEKEYIHFEHEIETLKELHSLYNKFKLKQHSMDYDDLLIYLNILLKNNPDIRAELSKQYSYIMVDEYQDTNIIQAEIIKYLTDKHKNIMVVGDDAQSIYAFRGANYKNIIQFPDLFPDTKIIKLEQNYRSAQPILTFTNMIIEKATEKFTKELFSDKKKGFLPRLIVLGGEDYQSDFVVEMIKKLTRKKNKIPLNEIAVLFRAAYLSYGLETKLAEANIDYVKYGGLKFMEKAHIKDILAHLRILIYNYDKISWQRVFTIIRGLGPKTADKICNMIEERKEGYKGIFNIKLSNKHLQNIKPLKDLLIILEQNSDSINEMINILIDYYQPYLIESFDDHPVRLKDLHKLSEISEHYKNLEEFLISMALEPPNNSSDNTIDIEDQKSESRLTLSTIHSAKGLEWNTVFIIWALEGRFPSYYSTIKDSKDEIEEELRLMYVAATRAKERLYITCPFAYDRLSKTMFMEPSRFVSDIPKNVLECRKVGI